MGLLKAIKSVFTGSEIPPELGRNERCWCGSGKKYKNCHLETDERKRASMRAASSGGSQGPMTRGF